jgi:hypothetical protein
MVHSPLRVSLIHRPYQVRPPHFDQGRGPVTDHRPENFCRIACPAVTIGPSAPKRLRETHMQASEDQLKAWMTRGLDGDAAAHQLLLRGLLPVLRQFYRRRMSGREDDVEDLVQETLIAVHQRRITYDPAGR